MREGNSTVLFFDVGDTLVFARRTLHEAIVEICRRDGVDVEESFVRTTAAAIKPTLGPVTTLDLGVFRDWWMRMYAELLRRCEYRGDVRAVREELWQLWRSGRALRLFPDTRDALQTLRDRGYRLAVVSNWDDSLENVLTQLEIRPYFERVFCSYALGVEKPDRRIFEHAMRGMKVTAGSAWHAGDSPDSDIAGAWNAGIRPILVDYFDRFAGREMNIPVARSLSDVPGIIGSE